MKVAVCSSGNTLESPVDPRFGRCAYFVLVDTNDMSFTAIQNPGSMMSSGAGIQAAQAVSGAGAEAVVAGNFGPNAYRALAAAGIKVYLGTAGTVGQVVELLKNGQLQEVAAPTVAAHFGMNATPGQGFGQGFGPGMGMGRGRGMGRGGGGGRGRGGR
jgi:predicted Fe-Mo cluster-binding NifX family protein